MMSAARHVPVGLRDYVERLREMNVTPGQIALVMAKPVEEIALWVTRFEVHLNRFDARDPRPYMPVPASIRVRRTRRRLNPDQTARLEQMHAEQGGKCFYCGFEALLSEDDTAEGLPEVGTPCSLILRRWRKATIEHLQRRADGGSQETENLVMACSFCNSVRGDREPHEHRRFIVSLITRMLHPHSRKEGWTIASLRKALKVSAP